MKLWIDDVRPMPKDFDKWAKTAEEAIRLLKTKKFTGVSFDHDLGEEINGTGYDVASWIEEMAFNKELPPLTWTIHSANPIGARRIRSAMTNASKFWLNLKK